MNDTVKRVVLLALVCAAGWRGWKWYRGRSVRHQVTFQLDGPQGCHGEIRYGLEASPQSDSQGLPWEAGPVDTLGHGAVTLRIELPRACNFQPEQVTCTMMRDGAAWKTGHADRYFDPANGELVGVRCVLTADPAE